jgi:hypothetical protein
MRILILFILLHLFVANLAFAGKEILPSQEPDSSPINMSEPPFWMSSYDEFNDLKDSQKAVYLENLFPMLQKVPALSAKTKENLNEASSWHESWEHIRKKIYEFCQDKESLDTCKGFADVRIKAFDVFAYHSDAVRTAQDKK